MLSPQLHRFTIFAFSLGGDQSRSTDCDSDSVSPLTLREDGTNTVRYTYRVTWEVGVLLFHIESH